MLKLKVGNIYCFIDCNTVYVGYIKLKYYSFLCQSGTVFDYLWLADSEPSQLL